MNRAEVQSLRERLRTKPKPFRPCSATTQRCPDARDYLQELRPCCRGHLVALMTRIADVLNALGVVWWADYGTLLGAVRNPLTTWAAYPWLPQDGRATAGPAPGIVPHDKDADVGVEWAAFDVVRRELGALRGAHLMAFGHRRSLKLNLSVRNQTNVDLFFWRDRGDGVLLRDHYAAVDQYKGREFPRDLLFPLTTVEWEGLRLPAPHDPEAFLAMRYGPNWRTPVAANNDGVRR